MDNAGAPSSRLLATRGFWLTLCAIVAVSLPALALGWMDDDAIHHAMFNDGFGDPGYGSHEAYCFAGGPNHRPPVWDLWWAEPGARVCFFRPLSSYTLAFDHWLFADATLGAHVHSFLWFLLTLVGVYALAKRLFDARVALVAVAIYGVANFSGSTVAWVASRHAIVTAALSALAVAVCGIL